MSIEKLAKTGWFKSSRSLNNAQCVEVRFVSVGADVRDSKNTGGPVLSFGSGAWASFVDRLAR